MAGSLGSGRVEYTKGRTILHFGSPAAPSGRDARKRALEDLYGADVPDSTAERVVMRDDVDPVVLSVN